MMTETMSLGLCPGVDSGLEEEEGGNTGDGPNLEL